MTRTEIIAVIAVVAILVVVAVTLTFAGMIRVSNEVPTPHPGDDPRPPLYDVEQEER